MQALYQWQYTEPLTDELAQQFLEDLDQSQLDIDYFMTLLKGTIDHIEAIDAAIIPVLDRGIHQLNPVELAILRISVYELAHQPDVPYRVVINEAIELAKLFGADKGHKYVNAILDRMATTLRSSEIKKSP